MFQQKDPVEVMAALVDRFGMAATQEWLGWSMKIQEMFIQSMAALNASPEIPGLVAPDAVQIIMRFASEDPEGAIGVLGVSSLGPQDKDQKMAMVQRAAEFLAVEDLFVSAATAAVNDAPRLSLVDEAGKPLQTRVAGGQAAPDKDN